MSSVTITIANKCKIPSNSNKAYVFSTRRAQSRVFSIPVSHVIEKRVSGIKINENHSEPSVTFTITSWIYSKIKEDLETMKEHDCIILPKKR